MPPSFRRERAVVQDRPISLETIQEPNHRDSHFVRTSAHEEDLKMVNKTLHARSKRSYFLCSFVTMLLLLVMAAIVFYYYVYVLVPRTEIVKMIEDKEEKIVDIVNKTKAEIVDMVTKTKAEIVKDNEAMFNAKMKKIEANLTTKMLKFEDALTSRVMEFDEKFKAYEKSNKMENQTTNK